MTKLKYKDITPHSYTLIIDRPMKRRLQAQADDWKVYVIECVKRRPILYGRRSRLQNTREKLKAFGEIAELLREKGCKNIGAHTVGEFMFSIF